MTVVLARVDAMMMTCTIDTYIIHIRERIYYILYALYIHICVCVCRVCTGERMSVYKILVAKGVEVVVTWQKTWESRKRAARVCICFLFHITNLLRLIECKIFQKRFLHIVLILYSNDNNIILTLAHHQMCARGRIAA